MVVPPVPLVAVGVGVADGLPVGDGVGVLVGVGESVGTVAEQKRRLLVFEIASYQAFRPSGKHRLVLAVRKILSDNSENAVGIGSPSKVLLSISCFKVRTLASEVGSGLSGIGSVATPVFRLMSSETSR